MAPTNGNGWSKLEADNYENGQFPRISLPVELMRESYDVVVIGSGYGGGVAASRMARGRQSVCLLERGKEKWPGEYPVDLYEAAKELHVSGRFAPNDKTGRFVDQGNRQGLYHLIFGEGQNAFVGNGLGGTSLLNANVFLPANKATFDMEAWPPQISEGSLREYYDRARKVLQPARYPEEWVKLPKYQLLERQAKKRGMTCEYVEQTTRFENGLNSTGVVMQQSQLTGMDTTGVNDGSKSSTLVNYLSDAWNWGAEMFCDCEVRHIEKHPTEEGWLVFFAWQGGRRHEFKKLFHSDLMWVHARKFVFLGAGALGTTEILLRSKQKCLKMSPLVGNEMSGNGDILAFGFNTDHITNGMGRAFPNQDYPIGPTITGIIDNRNQPNPMDDHVIEEGAIPEALARLMQPMFYVMPDKIFPTLSLTSKVSKLIARVRSLINPYALAGALERTQTYLIMSHDNNQATLTLEGTQPVLRFAEVGRSDLVAKYNKFLGEITTEVGGTFVNSPFFAKLGKQEITVHPIGGANMSSDNTAASGVTNHCGQLLTGDGYQVHDGLYVVDGAVIPTALGANPFATITALAERSVAWAADSKNIEVDMTPNDPLRFFEGPHNPHYFSPDKALEDARTVIRNAKDSETKGIEFSEVMEGYMHIGPDIEDFDVAEYYGKGDATLARIFLTVHAWDTDIFLHRKDHTAMLTGTFTCGAMPGRSYMIRRGKFQLFNYFSRAADTKNLTYDFDMVSAYGDKLHFHGYKVVDPTVAFSITETWKATTTLFVVITRPDKSVYARGKLHIKASDFLSELKTVMPTGRSRFQQLQSGLSFLKYFTSETAGLFFAPFSKLHYPSPVMRGYGYKKKAHDHKWKIWSRDDVPSWMHVWEPTKLHPDGRTRKILFIPGAAVDHQIFALPSIKENAIEYFTRKGFRCYTVTHRVGLTEVAHKGWTTYDARLDIAAALKEIRRLQDSEEPIYVVAHCAGSMALSMGLLDGEIPKEWISGISASNVFMNPIPGKVNDFKARLPSAIKAYKTLVGSWFSCLTSQHDTYIQRALNQVLRFYPVGGTGMRELCQNAVCHRSELVFGRLWSHKNLNAETHASLSQFLGGTSMESLAHFTACCRSQRVLTNDDAKKPEDEPASSIRTLTNIRRNLAGIPIFFFSGTENVIFKPESTSRDLSDMLGVFRNADLGKLDSQDDESASPLTRTPALSHDGDHSSSSDEDSPEPEVHGFLKTGGLEIKVTEMPDNNDGSSIMSKRGSKYSRQTLNPWRKKDREGPMYDRRVFDGRGHLDCWMSEKSKDVWNAVLRHIERVA